MKKFLIVGLGSMGKRRIRCLNTLGYDQISGVDIQEKRRNEAESKYGIKIYSDLTAALETTYPDALIISVPPDLHHTFMKEAVKMRIPFFVEASIVDTDLEEIEKSAKEAGILAAPSATMIFHPAITVISEIVKSGDLGKISNFIYHWGHYLPDWHAYEPVSDFYVSNPETGGCREIVAFELTWITRLFGFPKKVCGNFRKTITIEGAEKINDTYNILMDYGDFLTVMAVDVVSRYATKKLVINGSKKQLTWDWDHQVIRVFDPEVQKWNEISYMTTPAEKGYHPRLCENMYVDELRHFIEAAQGHGSFVNDLKQDRRVLNLLYKIEESDRESSILNF